MTINRSFTLTTNSGSFIDENLSAFNRVSGDNYVLFFSGSEKVQDVEVNFSKVNSAGDRGDFEDRDAILNTSGSAVNCVRYSRNRPRVEI